MTREENLEAMQVLNARAAGLPNNSAEMKHIRRLWYQHRIIEAMLSDNIDSLPTYTPEDK